MTVAINSIKLSCYSTTRDEAITKLDELGMQFLNTVKGEPWVVVADAYKKITAAEAGCPIISDDQGFIYTGVRTYLFRGPYKQSIDEHFGPGMQTQEGVE
jgi:hypothetical protein